MIRVLIAEDHALVRNGLQQLLGTAPDIEIVGAASDGEQAVAMAVEQLPDVVLMDLEMPNVDGIRATAEIGAKVASARVVILTSFSDRERIMAALDAGAIGYMLKDVEPEALLRGVRAAAHGDSPLDPKVASAIVTARREARPGAELSDRQLAVLALVASGKPNKLIARDLGISQNTVKAHMTAIFQTLGVSDRTQAALWAQRHGITSTG
jgi:DNA-binding NarL/FixJ family response regulator